MTGDQIAALGWKFPVGGISTRNGEITAWPANANGGAIPTQAEIDTYTTEYLQWKSTGEPRADATAALIDPAKEFKLLRAVLLTVLDELNLHALKINAILTAIDSGTTLAQVKANVAAIADYPQRTPAQVRTAVQNKINAGDADQ